MITVVAIAIILIISLLLALRSANTELAVPEEVKGLKIKRRKKLTGVILFLKEKIIHYSSSDSS